jgi:lipopolysaccharide transport system ATP-binding protein
MFRGYAGPADPPAGEVPGEGLLIVDDIFPNLLTGFRVAEFNHHLRFFPGLRIACTTPSFGEVHAAYSASYPDLADRVVAWDRHSFDAARAVYLVFLNNAHHWVPELEARGLPFGFTLYPGGGNNLNDDASSGKLARVLSSPALRGVIATQPITLEILDRHGCRAPITYVPGVTVNPMYLCRPRGGPRLPPDGEVRICFAAHKYEPDGGGKGYPQFLAAAAVVAGRHSTVTFSVIGNFGPEDLSVPDALAGRLDFKGPLPTPALRAAFLERDIMIAPSRRFLTTGSEFDGFPTGTAIEAALCGMALICSDELSQNRHYVDGEDLLICAPEADDLVQAMEALILDPQRLRAMRRRGQQKTLDLYGPEAQLLPRTSFLRRLALTAGIAM